MKRGWLIVLLVAGCGGSAGSAGPPTDGSAAVRLVPDALPPGPLTLTQATLRLEELLLLGDVQSSPGSTLYDVTIDALGSPTTVTFTHLTQGVYSRLRLSVESLSSAGTWNGTPVTVALELEDADADVRAAPQELAAGQTVAFAVAIDLASWFAGVDFADAVVDGGVIRIDAFHNVALAQTIANALPASFTLSGM